MNNDRFKKCYIGSNTCCDEEIIGIVASNSREAIKMARNSEAFEFCDYRFINTRVNLKKDINVDHLPFGEIDLEEGLKLDVYAFAWGIDCPECSEPTDEVNRAVFVKNRIMCEECEKKLLTTTPELISNNNLKNED